MSGERQRKGKRKRKQSDTNLMDLPSDVLDLIFIRLDYEHRLSISVVSKSFRSLTNRFVHNLAFKKPLQPYATYRKLFTRFSSVTQIALHSPKIITPVLTAVVNSNLKIQRLEFYCQLWFPSRECMVSLSEKLQNVKSLKLVRYLGLRVIDFIHMFPSLEELYVSCGNEEWIEKLMPNAMNLRKINLDCTSKLTDRSLELLSNCGTLEHVCFEGVNRMTPQGLSAFIRSMKNLKSLDAPISYGSIASESEILTLAETISFCENLSHLSINHGLMADAYLSVIANTRSSLTSLKLHRYPYTRHEYTMTGISVVIRAFKGLTRLHVQLPNNGLHTQDAEMSQLVKSLIHLKDICLISLCSNYATLASLIHNCPALESINLLCCGKNPRCDMPQLSTKNYSIQRIILFPKPVTELEKALRIYIGRGSLLMRKKISLEVSREFHKATVYTKKIVLQVSNSILKYYSSICIVVVM